MIFARLSPFPIWNISAEIFEQNLGVKSLHPHPHLEWHQSRAQCRDSTTEHGGHQGFATFFVDQKGGQETILATKAGNPALISNWIDGCLIGILIMACYRTPTYKCVI